MQTVRKWTQHDTPLTVLHFAERRKYLTAFQKGGDWFSFWPSSAQKVFHKLLSSRSLALCFPNLYNRGFLNAVTLPCDHATGRWENSSRDARGWNAISGNFTPCNFLWLQICRDTIFLPALPWQYKADTQTPWRHLRSNYEFQKLHKHPWCN